MARMKEDILSMKEPVFAVRPRVAFGLYEKKFHEQRHALEVHRVGLIAQFPGI